MVSVERCTKEHMLKQAKTGTTGSLLDTVLALQVREAHKKEGQLNQVPREKSEMEHGKQSRDSQQCYCCGL